ncbi:hypothetical protein HNP81_001693 [Peribacillus huizhouensis]|uniref:Uncharacterized protein n=1 Tax=Peribacillus huizhouensis TaxID=1501239 RepID=A0ABR6CN19_9BACI|nr:hypothetical protein [Peribacillus huizhouensis]
MRDKETLGVYENGKELMNIDDPDEENIKKTNI